MPRLLPHPVLLLASVVALGGCGGAATERAAETSPKTLNPSGVECYKTKQCVDARRVTLHTHCGVVAAYAFDEDWMATPPLFNGNGPPDEWGNPTTEGTFRLVSPSEAEFVSKSEDRVGGPGLPTLRARFALAPAGWQPPFCY